MKRRSMERHVVVYVMTAASFLSRIFCQDFDTTQPFESIADASSDIPGVPLVLTTNDMFEAFPAVYTTDAMEDMVVTQRDWEISASDTATTRRGEEIEDRKTVEDMLPTEGDESRELTTSTREERVTRDKISTSSLPLETSTTEEEEIATTTVAKVLTEGMKTTQINFETETTKKPEIHETSTESIETAERVSQELSLQTEPMREQVGASTEIPMEEEEEEENEEGNGNQEDDLTSVMAESAEATAIAPASDSNSTRNPKRIHEPRLRRPESRPRQRPARPDPGYSASHDSDFSRPYRPDARPYRGPSRQDTDYSRPARPDPDYSRTPVRPEFSYSRPSSQDDSDYSRQSSESGFSRPYRPQSSFSRPYRPQGAFARPYRPDRDYTRPSRPDIDYHSRPAEDFAGSSKPDMDYSVASQPDNDYNEPSHTDYDYTRPSESDSEFSRPQHSDIRPSDLIPDLLRPSRPVVDSMPPIVHSTSSDSDDFAKPPRSQVDTSRSPRPPRPSVIEGTFSRPPRPETASRPSGSAQTPAATADSEKPIKTDADVSRQTGVYPRPGFGSNYGQSTGTSVRPFSVGTITSARNLTRVEYIKADCFDNHMKVTVRFNGTFNGLMYSSGYSQDPSCSYINGSGRHHYEFYIRLNRCGTLGQQDSAEQRGALARRRQERAQYLVNTVTVQYNSIIEEEHDEHFRVTCEYGYDFWKTVTFPVVNVETSAAKVRTGSPVVFTLPPPQCNMEIRSGYGPSGNRIAGPVNVGDPLTLVIHMKSESTGFDILVSNCYAHNGAQKRLQLIDSNGCVIQEKLVSPFRGVSSPDRTQQVTLYSYLKAFRFTGSPALYIECDVHMCHGSCPPQRCYWRHLYKRSANEMSTTDTPENSVMSESVSLFQSLEVRHDDADSSNQESLKNAEYMTDEDVVCMRTGGFAAIFASLLLLLFLTSFTSICLCSRMRRLKAYVDAPNTKHFVDFDGHVPRK